MRTIVSLSRLTRPLLILTAVFMGYGYVCRLFNIYFFWESKTLGWVLFILLLVVALLHRVKTGKGNGRKTLLEKIGVGVLLFSLVVMGALFFFIPKTSAHDSALKFIHTNWYVRSQVGTIKGVFLVPYGGLALTSSEAGEAGTADLHYVVNGTKANMDLNLVMEKDFDTGWVIQVQE